MAINQLIYKIENKANGKVYIGQSVNYINRKSYHLKALERGDHFSKHLQASYDKYGCDNFEISIIEEVKDSDITERESYWISKLESYSPKKGYNKVKDPLKPINYIRTDEHRKILSDKATGRIHSVETKKKMSESKLKYYSENKSHKCKEISQFTKDGEFKNEYYSITNASNETCIGRRSIQNNLKGLSDFAGGYVWKYAI